MAGSSTVKKNIGTQGIQELFFGEFKTLGGSNTHWTFRSYDKVNPTSLFSYKVQCKKNCFTVGVAYKAFFSLYSVIVDCLGEGSSEKNCC